MFGPSSISLYKSNSVDWDEREQDWKKPQYSMHEDHIASPSLVPRLPRPVLSLAVWKAGGRPGRIYHMMRATADVT